MKSIANFSKTYLTCIQRTMKDELQQIYKLHWMLKNLNIVSKMSNKYRLFIKSLWNSTLKSKHQICLHLIKHDKFSQKNIQSGFVKSEKSKSKSKSIPFVLFRIKGKIENREEKKNDNSQLLVQQKSLQFIYCRSSIDSCLTWYQQQN